jgi:hypothetical protein
MSMRAWLTWSVLAVVWLSAAANAEAELPSYTLFEAGQVRPLARSPDGTRLLAVNTPNGQLEIYDIVDGELFFAEAVPVGLEPVAVAVRNDGEAWVVNHLSDSVSIVDLASAPARVVRTLLVGDEPRDIVFAGPSGSRAFITTAHRGQNSPYPRGAYDVEGTGRADVWVFDATSLGTELGGEPLTIVNLFGDRPRALAATPDGSIVFAAVFRSGNRTMTVSEQHRPDRRPLHGPRRAIPRRPSPSKDQLRRHAEPRSRLDRRVQRPERQLGRRARAGLEQCSPFRLARSRRIRD